jgi:hypothetical protein
VYLLAGTVWGILASMYYDQVISRSPLPTAVFLGVTLFLPGAIGRIIIYNLYGAPLPIPLFHANVFITTISVIFGIGVCYFIWWLRTTRIFSRV